MMTRRSRFWRPTRRSSRAQAKAQHLPLGRALERIRRRRQQAAAAVVALAGPARRRRVSVAEDDGRVGRDLSPAAVDARRGVSAADRCSPPRDGRRHRARTDRLARQSSTASTGDGHRRGQAAVGSRHGGAARLQDGRVRRRRTADRRRRSSNCSPRRTAFTWCADAGSKSIAKDSTGCSTSSEQWRRPPHRRASPSAKRCDSSPARTCQATSLRPPRPTGQPSSPGRGWRRRSPAFAIRPNWRNWIPAPR